MSELAVLDLLLSARYIGGPAFRQMEADMAGLVDSTSGLEKAGAALNLIGNAAIAAGIGIAAGLGYAVEKAIPYQQSLQRIAVTAQLTQPQINNLSDTAMNLADKWGISAQSIVDGSYFLISGIQALGYHYSDVVNNQILPAFAAYVEASGAGKTGAVDFQQAAQDLPHVLAGMHVPIQQWADALGQLTVVESQSGLSQTQLLASMTRFAPTAGFLGMDFGQTAALAGALSTLGVSGSGTGGARVGTEEAAALRNMFAGTGKGELMKILGTTDQSQLNQFFNPKTGQLSNVDPLLTLLYASLNSPKMTKDPTGRLSMMNSLFGATGTRAMAELMTPGNKGMPAGIQVYQNEMNAMKTPGMAYDTMLKIAQGQAQGPQAQWAIFQQRLQNLALVIGSQLIPPLLTFANYIGQAASKLRVFVEAHPQVVADAAKAVPALIGGGIGLKATGGLLGFLGRDQVKNGAGSILGGIGQFLVGKPKSEDKTLVDMIDRAQGKGGGVFGFGQRVGMAPFNLLGRMGRGVNALGEAEVAGKTYAPGESLAKRLGAAVENHFPKFAASRQGLDRGLLGTMLRDERGRFTGKVGEDLVKASPMASAKALGGDVFGGLKSIATGPVEKLVGLFGKLGTILPALPGALASFGAGLLPILAIVLVLAGVIAIVVLTFTNFRKEAETAGKTIGGQLSPIFKAFATIFQTAIKQIETAWNKAWPSIQKAMQDFFKELPKITPLLKVLGIAVGAIFAVIAGVVVALVKGFLDALPFIIGFISKVISLVGDFVQFVIDLFTNWKAIPKDIQALWSDIWGIITNFVGMIVHFIGSFVQGIIGFFQGLFDKLVGHSIIPDMITGIINWFLSLPVQAGKAIDTFVTSITTKIATFASTMLTSAATIGKNIVTGIGNGLIGAMGWLGTQFHNLITGAVNAIPGGAAAAKFLHIPGFALGTSFAPGGLAMVGEYGPELVNLPRGSQVSPNGQSAQPRSSNTFWETRAYQSIREDRYTPMQPVTNASLMNQLDYQYRWSYQRTA